MNQTSEQTLEGATEERLALTETLAQLSEINRYNRWIYDQFAHSLGHRVLEVGSGTGNITQFLLTENRTVVATDVVPTYRAELQTRFANQANLHISTFDLNRPTPVEFQQHPFDTIVCLNVLEHIEDDLFALQQMRAALKPGGNLALLVPAHQFLYGAFDEAVGHFRRYGKRQLRTRLEAADFQVQSLHFFNCAAMLPWFLNGRVLRRAYLPNEQVSLADKLVPLLKLESLIGPPCGISLIAIAQK
ncbi:MAG TPA: class I SAM-dependent methyltransferase [Blastocatellia bacterium]|nr:class I SAM-dependent methyltransferase [Blastocatellia bacterium]